MRQRRFTDTSTSTSTSYAPLADGETILAPGQTATVPELVAAGRQVKVKLLPWRGIRW